MILVVAPGVLGLLLLVFRYVAGDFLFNLGGSSAFYMIGVAIAVCLGTTGLGYMFMYLQTGLNRDRFVFEFVERAEREWRENEERNLAGDAQTAGTVADTPPAAVPESSAPPDTGGVGEPSAARVDIEAIADHVIRAGGVKLLDQLRSNFAKTLEELADEDRRANTTIRETNALIDRLREESRKSGYRGNLNLLIGITITALGIGALFYYVSGMPPMPEKLLPWRFVEHFVPRLALVVFIEIFAYFFLKLYKESLAEIKYYQNELTTVQARRTALLVSMLKPADATAAAVVMRLADTERNMILQANQTTPELRRAEIERATTAEILKEISNIVRAGTKGGGKDDGK